jgi:hypothetical protein
MRLLSRGSLIALVVSGLACSSTSGATHPTPGTGGSPPPGTGGSGGSAPVGGAGGSTPTGGTGELPPVDAAAPDAASAPDASTTAGADGAPPVPGCQLVWSPSALKDGFEAFEGLEMPDMPGIATHTGVSHTSIVAEHDAYRIDQHYAPPIIDYDRRQMDRVRCETKGFHVGGKNLELLEGQTWRITWSFLVPATLKASGRFNHIWQMKYVTTGGTSSDGPLLTLDLSGSTGGGQIKLDVFGVANLPGTDLTPLHDRWLSADVTLKIAGGTGGSVHFILKDGDTVLTDASKDGISLWPADTARLRPKWGIYRGLGDPSVETTYILLSDLKAYTCN